MIKTSANYNPYTRARSVDFALTFGVMLDEAAIQTATPVITPAFVGSAAAILNGIDDPSMLYASLEQNAWELNGKHRICSDNISNYEFGFWSEAVSDENGQFQAPPAITVAFDSIVSTLGWTFSFDEIANEYPVEIAYTTYQGGTIKDTGYIHPDGAKYQHEVECRDYDRVVFVITKTNNPFRRARVTELTFGITRNYNKNNLVSVGLKYGAAVDGSSLPASELEFKFDNSDKKYNILNPDDVYQYLQEGQAITCKAVMNGESVYMGTYYYKQCKADGDALTPSIVAYDRIIALDGREFENCRDQDVTLRNAVNEIIALYNLPVAYNGNENTIVNMCIPEKTTIREALRMVCQAACCSCYIDRNGILQIKKITIGNPDGEITANELYDFSGVALDAIVGGLKLTAKNEYKIWTDDHGNEKVGKTCRYESGDPDAENVASYNNPCVSETMGQAVADWLFEVVNWRKQYDIETRGDPAVEIGDTLKIQDIYDNREDAAIIGLDLKYDGGLKCTTEAVGR